MDTTLSQATLQSGTHLTPEQMGLYDMLESTMPFLGLHIGREFAVFIVGAGLFFIGILIAYVQVGRNAPKRQNILLSAPLIFLISAPIWVNLLNGKVVPLGIARIDSFLKWGTGHDGTVKARFPMGIVLLNGILSCPLYNFVIALVPALGRQLQSRLPTAKPEPPAKS